MHEDFDDLYLDLPHFLVLKFKFIHAFISMEMMIRGSFTILNSLSAEWKNRLMNKDFLFEIFDFVLATIFLRASV